MKRIDVTTEDGTCPVYLHTPAAGVWPGIIMFMDAPGIRPALHELAQRLADSGYAVLLPDMFYRSGPYEPVDPKRVWGDPELREAHRKKFNAKLTPKGTMADVGAILEALEGIGEVTNGRVGVVGYCMGGKTAVTAAGTYPERIVAAASYHAGGLADDSPASPHLLAPRLAGRVKVYVAGAIQDANFDDAQKQRLIAALDAAGVDSIVESYPAKHGWVPRDMPVHDAAEAEHHWRTLVPFMDSVLKR